MQIWCQHIVIVLAKDGRNEEGKTNYMDVPRG